MKGVNISGPKTFSAPQVNSTPSLQKMDVEPKAETPQPKPEKMETESTAASNIKKRKAMDTEMQVQTLSKRNKLEGEVGLGSSATKVKTQSKYGPKADVSTEGQQKLTEHYGGTKSQSPLKRLTQYDPKHSTYVKDAEQNKRPLTQQEDVAKQTAQNSPNSSIDHIIASGTGQNIMNKGTLQFKQGAEMVDTNFKKAQSETDGSKEQQEARNQTASGLAKQAAAVGRQQGYSRVIINERPSTFDIQGKRNETLQNTLTAFQGKSEDRFGAYQSTLKDTFDSPGNLRVGNDKANIKISTGFDPELDANGKPTPRTQRLMDAHQTFAPDELLTDDRLFTRDDQGKIISSSKQVPGKNNNS